ncbi:hypothetical protein OVA26_16370 [Microbacterium sp. SL62]|uniref:hypothetical protein n=1 Tax=Microbacterium sp. SL62 TaxID=2995139 RepID=UPI0022735F43|nr:hypothetical protein [Microbacterium sp. SL62]MCY1718512.1 hypothetical protein [Microbacterium sp. SL62]
MTTPSVNPPADAVEIAAEEVRAALARYRTVMASADGLGRAPLVYEPSTVGWDVKRFTLGDTSPLRRFPADAVLAAAAEAADPMLEMLMLSASPHWEDRIRAEALRGERAAAVTLPDRFPCIFEPADSPKKQGELSPRPFAWVVSPDEDMLRELLPLYRELWLSYEGQWPHSPNRTFEFGYLDGLAPRGVYRPGATVEDVIGSTFLTHADMYRLAPEHLRQMSFRNRAERGAL